MAVAVKKYKLFRVCKELNLGIETLGSFLEEKGIKVKGPNTSFPEEIYKEILERFAREKESAEKLSERKKQKTGEGEAGTVDEESVHEVKKSTYVQAIERSIEERAAQLEKGEEEVPEVVEEVKPPETVEEPKVTEEEAAKQVVEEVKEIIQQKPTAEPEKTEQEKPAESVENIEEKPAKKAEAEKTVSAESEIEKGRSKKPKPHGKKAREKEETPAEKDSKRRKAFEMIRKEEKKRKQTLMGDDVSGEAIRPKRSRKQRRKKVDQQEVQQTVKKTLATIDDKLRKPKKRKKVKKETGEVVEENVIYASEFISANDLANLMDVPVAEIITKCLELGLVVSINQRLDIDTIELLAGEWGYGVVKEEEFASDILEDTADEDDALEDDTPRSPIVTIMGHVDHGKTSLLDFIRETNVVAGESGGITQHIGAYEVEKNGKKITFLDTPGHEAFTAMRARGAQVTDIVILIIAADDQVMPQTDEALDHARAAGVKIVIAINKMDKPGANPEKIRQQLAERNVLVEDWGGEYQCVEISAKSGVGVDTLLEKVLLEAELLDLKANPKKKARGTVIESRLDKGKGTIATVLVQNGTLRIGDPFIAGQYSGKVRALIDSAGKRVQGAGPSTPIQVLGFDGLPQAGDRFAVMADERTVREISLKRQQIKREQDFRQVRLRTLDQISESIKHGGFKELRVLVKADVDGSAEALSDALLKLGSKEVSVNVIRKAVGPISESDVLLAAASDAIIIGFHVRPNIKAKEVAAKEKVEIRLYKVVYDAINDVKMALEGMLGTEKSEEVIGTVEIRETFKISRLGTIAGCYVKDGKITRNSKIRLIRDDVEIYDGELSSLKRFKEDVKEVASGFECGLQIQNYNDIKVGDIVEVYQVVETKRTLESANN